MPQPSESPPTLDPMTAQRRTLRRIAGSLAAGRVDRLGLGKPSAETLAVRSERASAVSRVLERRSATPEALAGVLGCSLRAIHRLPDGRAGAA
jgi:hypothetical protein